MMGRTSEGGRCAPVIRSATLKSGRSAHGQRPAIDAWVDRGGGGRGWGGASFECPQQHHVPAAGKRPALPSPVPGSLAPLTLLSPGLLQSSKERGVECSCLALLDGTRREGACGLRRRKGKEIHFDAVQVHMEDLAVARFVSPHLSKPEHTPKILGAPRKNAAPCFCWMERPVSVLLVFRLLIFFLG